MRGTKKNLARKYRGSSRPWLCVCSVNTKEVPPVETLLFASNKWVLVEKNRATTP